MDDQAPIPRNYRICRASALRRVEILATRLNPAMELRIDMTCAGSPTSSPEADRIRNALHQQLGHPDQDLATLRGAVCAFVATLRDLGLPPERTLVAVKEVMGSVHAPPHRLDRQRDIARLVAEWCVEEYYGKSA